MALVEEGTAREDQLRLKLKRGMLKMTVSDHVLAFADIDAGWGYRGPRGTDGRGAGGCELRAPPVRIAAVQLEARQGGGGLRRQYVPVDLHGAAKANRRAMKDEARGSKEESGGRIEKRYKGPSLAGQDSSLDGQ